MSQVAMTREEWLAWCKARALEYVDAGNLAEALASMCSDLRKDTRTRDHPGIELGMQMAFAGLLNTPDKMRKFIEGFN